MGRVYLCISEQQGFVLYSARWPRARSECAPQSVINSVRQPTFCQQLYLFWPSIYQRPRERQRDRETGRQRDRETERQRDSETERQRDRETERQRDRVSVIQIYRETERQRDKETH